MDLRLQMEEEFKNSEFHNWDEFLIHKIAEQKDENERLSEVYDATIQEREKLLQVIMEIDNAYKNTKVKDEEFVYVIGLTLKKIKGEC